MKILSNTRRITISYISFKYKAIFINHCYTLRISGQLGASYTPFFFTLEKNEANENDGKRVKNEREKDVMVSL